MKYSLVILVIFISSLCVKAQTNTKPDVLLASEISSIARKIGSQANGAIPFSYGFQKMTAPDDTHDQYISTAHSIVIILGKDDAGNINSVECDMFTEALPTIKAAIDNMGLKPSDEAGPDGYTVYAGLYKGFLSVGEKTIRFIITSKEIIAGE
jgi:hypothetical protein